MSVAPAKPARVLLIDSNVFFARRLISALKREGIDSVHATASAYGLTMLEWDRPDAIVCSTSLRELNAFEIPRILRGDESAAHIPVVAVGNGGEHALMEAYRAGCEDYVDRRLGADTVATHLRDFLSSRHDGFQPVQMLSSDETALEGRLSHLELPGVIQMLGHSRQTGALHVNAGATDGIVFFDAGEVVHAESGELVGEDAVLHIVKSCDGVNKGIYKFVPGDTASTRTVLRSITELMLEALRALDEERAQGGLP